MRVGKRSSPIQSGRAPTWAGAVVYALGQVNFLFDSDTKPYATADDLSAAFGVAKSTLSAKAKQVRGHHNHTFGTNFCRHQLEIGVSGNWTIRLLQQLPNAVHIFSRKSQIRHLPGLRYPISTIWYRKR